MLLGCVFVSFSLHTCLNSTIVDLRLNENKIRSVHYSSLSRFGNLTYLNLTKNDISYVEDGAFSAQFNLQVGSNIIYIVYRKTDIVMQNITIRYTFLVTMKICHS